MRNIYLSGFVLGLLVGYGLGVPVWAMIALGILYALAAARVMRLT